MTAISEKYIKIYRLISVFIVVSLWVSPVLAELSSYETRYSIYRNGKLSGKAEVSLQQEDGQWVIRSEGRGTHGLAKIIGARDTEYTKGQLVDGRFIPDEYFRHTRVAAIDNRWLSTFNWPRDEVVIVHDGKKTFHLELQGEALDPLALKLEMRRRLMEPDPDLNFLMVEEDEIDPQKWRVLEREWLETALGCLETIPIEKVRDNNRRYTRAWHAPAFGNIEVRVEHGKTNGNHMEMRITELEFDGMEVVAGPGCSARQSAGAGTD
jgi:hypothetical protein